MRRLATVAGAVLLSAAVSVVAQPRKPAHSGYAKSSEGLEVFYEVRGKGEPIVLIAGGFIDQRSMAKVIDPLSRTRKVIGLDLEGHGRTALRDTPMSHERNGDDVAAVLRHLGIAKADVGGYSHGADAAIRAAIQHPSLVRNLIVISTAAQHEGWYPDNLKAMREMNAAAAEQMKKTAIYRRHVAIAPKPQEFGLLADRMGELLRKDYDWTAEIAKLPMPALLVFADHDAVSTRHIADFFALFGGGLQDPGFEGQPKFSRARLAILPGYTHYNGASWKDHFAWHLFRQRAVPQTDGCRITDMPVDAKRMIFGGFEAIFDTASNAS